MQDECLLAGIALIVFWSKLNIAADQVHRLVTDVILQSTPAHTLSVDKPKIETDIISKTKHQDCLSGKSSRGR